ncbi:MAG: WcaI family glycosyltransferase [Bacteroidetes bacterium]|nr:WcaI family glycosyltransferase [Bacteroidota bacterium]
MQKNILLISGNYFPEPTGIGKYNNEMMIWLADNGFNCTVIAPYPYYPYWKVQPPYIGKNKWFLKEQFTTVAGNQITIYRCPHYVPANPTGKKRVMLDLSYFTTVCLKLIALSRKKFDYVMSVSPPLFAGIAGALYKKTHKAKLIYHVQDLQVDVAANLKMIKSKKAIKLLFKIEKYILNSADVISTISTEMAKKLETKSNKPVYLFPNWVDTNALHPVADKAPLKIQYGIDANRPIVLYSGSIGEKQGIDMILNIAEKFLQEEKLNAKFVICSSGPYKDVLEKKATERKIDNLLFMPLKPYEELNQLLNMADIHLIIQKADVAGNLMPSKLNSILSVGGLCIVTANPGTELYATISNNEIGLVCPAEDSAALFNTISDALTGNYNHVCLNARKFAEKFISVNQIMEGFVNNALQ